MIIYYINASVKKIDPLFQKIHVFNLQDYDFENEVMVTKI